MEVQNAGHLQAEGVGQAACGVGEPVAGGHNGGDLVPQVVVQLLVLLQVDKTSNFQHCGLSLSGCL